VTKIMRHEYDSWIFRNISSCIFVLVESDELTIITQFFKNGIGVAAAAESAININTIGLYIESIDRFFQKNRYVIRLIQ